MAITEAAKAYCETMFPSSRSSLLETDPEFMERFYNFAYDEVVNQDDLDGRTRFLAILAALLGCQGAEEFRCRMGAANGVMSGYDTVFLGYPIWWGEAPNILRTFLEETDLSGKTVIPFCTSSSSGLGSSAETLQAFAPNANWLDGRRFPSRASQADVSEWALSLDIQ